MDRSDSAGTICFFGRRVLLIKYYSNFSFPKGHIEEGESAPAAAIRETKEETGIEASIVAPAIVVPSAKKGDERKIYFFPSLYSKGEITPEAGEVDEAFWLDVPLAQKLLTFECDRKALIEASRIVGVDIE